MNSIGQLLLNFENGVEAAEEIMTGLAIFEGKLQKEHELNFFYQFAYIYFGAGQFNKALSWLNKVLNDNENTLRQDLYSYARLFNLVIHYELGNYDLLEYTIKSTSRYLQKRERDFPMEKVIIDNFKKIIKNQSAADRKKHFLAFYKELEVLKAEPENEIVFKYFDFCTWVKGKAQ